MKKLLSMLAVSTLVGTSASSLKPLCISNVSQGFKSNHSNKNISIQGENATNPFLPKRLSTIGGDIYIQVMITTNDDTIYVGTDKGIYKSTDTITFNKINDINCWVNSLVVDKKGNIYAGWGKSLWVINPTNLLLNINNDGFFADKKIYNYGGVVYNSVQKIDIKDKLVETSTLDTKNITIPTTNLDLTNGQHTLVLTLKDKSLASIFGGDNNTWSSNI